VADLFADGAELFDAHGERIAGREELDAYWSAIESPVDWRLSIRLARGSEGLAYEIGTSRMTTRESGELVTRVTEFLMLWRRGPDGAWRIAMDSSWPKPR
jgi:ketosteroid isomerase-like protein